MSRRIAALIAFSCSACVGGSSQTSPGPAPQPETQSDSAAAVPDERQPPELRPAQRDTAQRPQPERAIGTDTTIVRVDTVIEAVSLSDEDIRAAQARGTSVDTILVEPTEVMLRVGETVLLFDALHLRALDRDGAPVLGFTPALIHSRRRATERVGPTLRAARPGVDTVFVEALPRNPSAPRPRPSTMILIKVTG